MYCRLPSVWQMLQSQCLVENTELLSGGICFMLRMEIWKSWESGEKSNRSVNEA